MSRRFSTSRHTFHSTDALDDSLDVTMQIERMIAEHGEALTEALLLSIAKKPDRVSVKETVRLIASGTGR